MSITLRGLVYARLLASGSYHAAGAPWDSVAGDDMTANMNNLQHNKEAIAKFRTYIGNGTGFWFTHSITYTRVAIPPMYMFATIGRFTNDEGYAVGVRCGCV